LAYRKSRVAARRSFFFDFNSSRRKPHHGLIKIGATRSSPLSKGISSNPLFKIPSYPQAHSPHNCEYLYGLPCARKPSPLRHTLSTEKEASPSLWFLRMRPPPFEVFFTSTFHVSLSHFPPIPSESHVWFEIACAPRSVPPFPVPIVFSFPRFFFGVFLADGPYCLPVVFFVIVHVGYPDPSLPRSTQFQGVTSPLPFQ